MFNLLGKEEFNSYIDDMLSEVFGLLNFIMFLMLMGEKLNGIDFEDMIWNVFVLFDMDGKGVLNEDKFWFLLMGMGER